MEEAIYDRALKTFADPEIEQIEKSLSLKKLATDRDDKKVEAFVRLLRFITRQLTDGRNYEKETGLLNDTFVRLTADNPTAAKGWERIRSSLTSLEDYLVEQKKESIKDRYARIVEFQITSDARPIFNIGRTELREFIFPHILKIETSDDQTFLCEFYDDDLDELISELELAKRKAQLIRESCGANGPAER